jgi:PAS domain S-box-containing protein
MPQEKTVHISEAEQSKRQLLRENKELRSKNEELENVLIECKRAVDVNSDMKTLVEVAQDLVELKRAQEALKKERDYFKNVLDNSADAIGIVDSKGRFIRWNKRAEELFGYSFRELEGKSAFDLYADKNELAHMLAELRQNGYIRDYEITIRRKDGRVLPFQMSISMLKEMNATIGSVCVARDVSQIKQVQAALRQTNERLEQLVEERTSELTRANKKLEEANIALRVLLEKKDETKRASEENMVFNVKQLIQPCLEGLKSCCLHEEQRAYVEMIETRLEEVISPFQRDLSHRYGLTPTEIQLVEFIKKGKLTKEIAEVLQLSKRTIDTHRHNIRKKLGLANTNINLRSYLTSLNQDASSETPLESA